MADQPLINPSWTASAGNVPPSPTEKPSANGSAPALTSTSGDRQLNEATGQLAGPPPMAANPDPLTPTPSPAASSILQSASPPVIPKVQPAPETTPTQPELPPELIVLPTPQGKLFPWRRVLIGLVASLLVGGIVYGLWWLGIGFGAPRNPQVALKKMAAALAVHPAYHIEGRLGLNFTAADKAAISSTQSAVSSSTLAWLTTVAQAATTETPTTKIPTFPQAPKTYDLKLEFMTDRTSETVGQTSINLDLSGLSDLLPETFPTTATLEARWIGNAVYLRLPLLSLLVGSTNNQWLYFDRQDFNNRTVSGEGISFDYSKLFSRLQNARRVGFERIGPIQTAHYTAELPVAELIRLLNFSASQFDPSQSLTIDWWLGVVNHLPYQIKINGTAATTDLTTSVNLTTSFSRYDVSVAVDTPDPDQITNANLGELLKIDLNKAKSKARDTKRKSDLAALKSALSLYHADHGNYPSTKGETIRTDQAGNPLTVLVTQGYIQVLPDDPLAESHWYGYKSSDGSTYELWSVLEDTNDPLGIARDNFYLYIVTP